jgi:hypothetical protein
MSALDDQQWAAAALRATADLVERGLVRIEQVDIEYHHHEWDDYQLGMRRHVPTGAQTVTITLYGNPHDLTTAGFEGPRLLK